MNVEERLNLSNAIQSTVSWMRGDEPSVLTCIYHDSINLTLLERELEADVHLFARSLCESEFGVNLRMALDIDTASQSLEKVLPALPGRHEFIKDLSLLIDMYGCLFDLEEVGVRLQTTDRAMCPRFHVDRLGCRLVTTYSGPGTEWLPNHAADRSKLGQGSLGKKDCDSGLYTTESEIFQARIGDVLLLKGEGWFGNEGSGAIHRSPRVGSKETRLVLTLDFA